jgi:hypothetical protein
VSLSLLEPYWRVPGLAIETRGGGEGIRVTDAGIGIGIAMGWLAELG